MVDPHVIQYGVAFAMAMWWSKSWLVDRPVSRWRFILAGFVNILLWIAVAYMATRVVAPSGGVGHVFGSQALAIFGAFMAVLSVVGLLLGVYLWVEEEAEDATEELPGAVRTGFGD